MSAERTVIFLVGPTAVGKSAVAFELVQSLGTELISADSRQVYRGMDIGTAKPTPAERARVTHHLLDVVEPDQPFSAGQFRVLASAVIEKLHQQGRIPIVIGGTGLYVKLLAYGVWQGPPSATGADWDLRRRLRREEEIQGAGYLHHRLREIDPESAARIKPRDLSKIIRAIEVFEKTGRPLSAFHREHRFQERPYRAVMIGLRRSRPDLYRRIEERVDRMMKEGLVEEVRGLLSKGYSPDLSSMQGLGYRQIIGYLKKRYDLTEAVRLLKRDTKRYAKRQMTWFNRDPSIQWIDLQEADETKEAWVKVDSVIRKETGNG
jgi:tRNA dimethylallyltransferase